jgi:hypothetical protein
MTTVGALSRGLVHEIMAAQTDSGAFASVMVEDGTPHADVNGFVTAQVLRTLGAHTSDVRLHTTVGRALDFLESCEDPNHAGTYRFWPETHRPRHVPTYPADADDTALIAMELARHGRTDPVALRRTVLVGLFPYRVRAHPEPPASWVVPGAFWTWLDDDFGYNVVDCTVNANVVALLATTGLTQLPCYHAACAMIARGVAQAGGDAYLTRVLSPYYPHPGELLLAVQSAVDAGADSLGECLTGLQKWARRPADASAPVFCSAYGRVSWRAPLLHRLRAELARTAVRR